MNLATAVVVVILVIVVVLGIRSTRKRATQGCCNTGSETTKKVKAKDSDKSHYHHAYELRIDGMMCANCATRIENAFHENTEYLAKADLSTHSVTVYTKEPASDEQLKEPVKQLKSYVVLSVKEK